MNINKAERKISHQKRQRAKKYEHEVCRHQSIIKDQLAPKNQIQGHQDIDEIEKVNTTKLKIDFWKKNVDAKEKDVILSED